MVIAIIIIAIIVLIIAWVISVYNKLVMSRLKVREAFSTMDVFLKKRYDLIPNLVATVQGYVKHEEGTFVKITELRSAIGSAPKESRMELEKEMTSAISRLLMVVENYPQLKADTQFLNLQSQLKSIEEDIEKSRRYYNGTVTNLNTLVNIVPSNIVAGMFNIKEEPFFEIENKEHRENVQIQF